ncbi:nuclear mRNA export, poly(A)+RNA binding protein [Fusarium falciforme]|nr:nuclear mRNA export, poly(A)+RNA binding protein [Fusarium falciforme]
MDCHPLQGLADPSGQSPGGVDGLIITVHGEFEEQDPGTNVTGKRSFSVSSFLDLPSRVGESSVWSVTCCLLERTARFPTSLRLPLPLLPRPTSTRR